MSTLLQKEISEKIASGCSREEFDAFRCPECGSALLLNLHHRKRSFFVRCAGDSLHFGVLGEAQPSSLPGWMDEKITGGWLE